VRLRLSPLLIVTGSLWLRFASGGISAAWAQASSPRLGYVYPAGGKQGTTLRIEVGGQMLRGADDVYISGDGVSATVLEYVRPLGPNELNDVSEILRNLIKRRWSLNTMRAIAADPDPPKLPDHPWLRGLDRKSLGEIVRLRNRLFDPKQQPNAQLADHVDIEVTIAPNAPPGDRELRVITPAGITNPVRFQIGTLPEVREEEAAEPILKPLDVPVVLNGQISPGDVDRFLLRLQRGQKLVCRMFARYLVPYVADAVPGWFQGILTLYDAEGREVAFADDYRFDPDPVILFVVPQEGTYTLEIRDSIYRGREDFVYRIYVGELPFVTEIFPLGGRVGASLRATLKGWNLPVNEIALNTAPGADSLRWAVVGAAEGLPNSLPYLVDDFADSLEKEPNNNDSAAQNVSLPQAINGRIGQPGDRDVFALKAQAGETIIAEVFARRLFSPLDAFLELVDESGQIMAHEDDFTDPAAGLITHQADPLLRIHIAQTGTYYLRLGDTQGHGGEAYVYRLQLRHEQPDFALRVTPSSISVPPGGRAKIKAMAIRKDGFEGPIEVALKDAPAGFTLAKARIAEKENAVEMELAVPRGLLRQILPLEFEGRASIGENIIIRPALPSDEMMQAFAYTHLVPQQEFIVAIRGPGRPPVVWRPLAPGLEIADPQPLRFKPGDKASLRIRAPSVLPDRLQTPREAVRFALSNRVRGITIQEVSARPEGFSLTFLADAQLVEIGQSGYLIIEAYREWASVSGAPKTRHQRLSLGVLRAVPYEILAP